jgi:hypothetical protein
MAEAATAAVVMVVAGTAVVGTVVISAEVGTAEAVTPAAISTVGPMVAATEEDTTLPTDVDLSAW